MKRLLAMIPRRRERREWLVWSDRRNAWWRADSTGYAGGLADAGLYTEAEARALFADTWPNGTEHSEPRHVSTVAKALDAEIARAQATLASLISTKATLLTARRRRRA